MRGGRLRLIIRLVDDFDHVRRVAFGRPQLPRVRPRVAARSVCLNARIERLHHMRGTTSFFPDSSVPRAAVHPALAINEAYELAGITVAVCGVSPLSHVSCDLSGDPRTTDVDRFPGRFVCSRSGGPCQGYVRHDPEHGTSWTPDRRYCPLPMRRSRELFRLVDTRGIPRRSCRVPASAPTVPDQCLVSPSRLSS